MKATSRVTFLLIGFFLVGCGNSEVDINSPTMEEVSYSPQPSEDEICGAQEPVVFRLVNNEELTFDVIFKDDEALSQYKVDIHNNFDCHGHGGANVSVGAGPNVQNQTTDWSVLDIQDITGNEAPIVRTLTVPDNVTAGNYHFHIQVIDESGNDSPFANFNSLKIKNLVDTLPPEIIVEQPTEASFSRNKGEAIRFVGQVSDNRSLNDGGNGVLFLSYTDLNSGNTFNTDVAFVFDATENVFEFDFEFIIPQTLISNRTYRFSLGANDGVRNVAAFAFFDVEVL